MTPENTGIGSFSTLVLITMFSEQKRRTPAVIEEMRQLFGHLNNGLVIMVATGGRIDIDGTLQLLELLERKAITGPLITRYGGSPIYTIDQAAHVCPF